jgi:hypothetical protein
MDGRRTVRRKTPGNRIRLTGQLVRPPPVSCGTSGSRHHFAWWFSLCQPDTQHTTSRSRAAAELHARGTRRGTGRTDEDRPFNPLARRPSLMELFDVVVVGSGPGSEPVWSSADGRSVAVVGRALVHGRRRHPDPLSGPCACHRVGADPPADRGAAVDHAVDQRAAPPSPPTTVSTARRPSAERQPRQALLSVGQRYGRQIDHDAGVPVWGLPGRDGGMRPRCG